MTNKELKSESDFKVFVFIKDGKIMVGGDVCQICINQDCESCKEIPCG